MQATRLAQLQRLAVCDLGSQGPAATSGRLGAAFAAQGATGARGQGGTGVLDCQLGGRHSGRGPGRVGRKARTRGSKLPKLVPNNRFLVPPLIET